MKTDSMIQADVISQLQWDPRVTHEHIGVSVKDGIVTLSGSVPTFSEKHAAELTAQKVTDVKAVVEKIEVKLPAFHQRDDQDIAEAISNQFHWSVQVPDKLVKVSVEKGWVTLTGEVMWAFQRTAAETCVRHLSGVKGVTNNISIKEKEISPIMVKQKIEEALKREAKHEAERIMVNVSGHKVTLTGNVRSHSESEDARWAAWCAPGVTTVDNKLQINENL